MTQATFVPTEVELQEIVDQVWSSYLDPEGVYPLIPADLADAGDLDVNASVSITGSWHGHVLVACSAEAARQATAAFMQMELDEVVDDDVADVIGELVNIVGGNVKSMLPAGCFVSLPHVVISSSAAVHWPGVVRIATLAGRWRDEPMSVSMWQQASQTPGGTAE